VPEQLGGSEQRSDNKYAENPSKLTARKPLWMLESQRAILPMQQSNDYCIAKTARAGRIPINLALPDHPNSGRDIGLSDI
jgi:hypothetical protein